MPKRLADLSADELLRLSPENAVFFLAVGPLEDHGPHLPLGLDGIEGMALAERLAADVETRYAPLTAILFPYAPLGIDSNTSKLAIRVRGHVLRDYLVDACQSLADAGFKRFVCVSGHPGPRTLTAIEEAGKILRARAVRFGFFGKKSAPVLVSASSASLDADEASESIFFANPPEHGGKRDASMAKLLAPSLLSPAAATLPAIAKEETAYARWSLHRRGKVSGYWGDPAKADADYAARALEEKSKALLPKLKAVWDGSNPNGVFRSWYSVFPPNKSLFKVWILVFCLLVALGAYVMVALQTLFQNAQY